MIATTTFKRLCLLLFVLGFMQLQARHEVVFSLICPADVTVDCTAELWDLSSYGNAQYHDYSGYHDAGNPYVEYNLSSCNTGTITRTWSVEDPNWYVHTCTQTITVGNSGGFNGSDITWPANKDLVGCNPDISIAALGKPTWIPTECSMLGVSYTDKLYTVTPDCKKIMRKWTVLDWCQAGNYNQGTYTYTQIIKIINSEPPVINCPAEITINSTDCKFGNLVVDPLVVNASQCGGQYTITNNSPYSTTKGPNISGKYPVGTTKVTYTVTYGCGTKKTCIVNVIVKNNIGPTPICVQGLAIALMGIDSNNDGINDEGMVSIWAKDLNWKSASICGYEPLRYTFDAAGLEMSKTFTCDQVGNNKLKMYVTDSKGGQSYCQVTISVQNNGAHIQDCEPIDTTTLGNKKYNLSGRIKDVDGKGIAGADIELQNTKVTTEYITTHDTTYVEVKDSFINYSGALLIFTNIDQKITTTVDTVNKMADAIKVVSNEKGEYEIAKSLEKLQAYRLSCLDINDDLKDIDNADLEMLTSYLIGKAIYDKPYQYLASDVTGDGKIDYDDLKLMIDYITGDITNFDQNHVIFMEDTEITNTPQLVLTKGSAECTLNEIKDDIKNVDFVLVQRGDIVRANGLLDKSSVLSEGRNSLSEDGVTIYPNPFKEDLTIDYSAAEACTIQISLMDSGGKIIYKSHVDVKPGVNSIQVTPGEVAPGIVFYHITNAKHSYTGKIISLR